MPNYIGASPEQAEEDAILTAFAAARERGTESPEADALVERWRAHLARYHNGCDVEKLRRLAALYGADDRFAEHLDSYGAGTAHFMAEAIEVYLERH